MVIGLVVVVCIPSIDYLSDRAADQSDNQADCIATRPPPPSCQTQAVPVPPNPDDDDDADGIPNKYDDDVDWATAPTVTVATASHVWGTPAPSDPGDWPPADGSTPVWDVSAEVTITDSGGSPVAGATCRAQISEGSFPQTVEVTSDASGVCTLDHEVTSDVSQVSIIWTRAYFPDQSTQLSLSNSLESHTFDRPAFP